MRKSALLAVSVTLALVGATQDPALARSVCYESNLRDEVIVLDVGFHSVLVNSPGVPRQRTYSAHGKVVASGGAGLFAEGATIIVGRRVGALLFIPANDTDCSSNEDSPRPEEWQCEDGLTLTKVDPSTNELCDLFFVPDFNADSITPNTSNSSDLHLGH
jgi:hypothetical protein